AVEPRRRAGRGGPSAPRRARAARAGEAPAARGAEALVSLALALVAAAFLLASSVLSLVVALAVPLALPRVFAERPRARSRLLVGLRLRRSVGALLFVLGSFLPSYLLYEPQESGEVVGRSLLVLALVGLGLWGLSLGRGLRLLQTHVRTVRGLMATA